MLRGRETVRADRRLRADKKPSVRNRRSRIKTHAVLVLTLSEFSVRRLLIRTEDAVGARERASQLPARGGI